jgi:hypothetical protein
MKEMSDITTKTKNSTLEKQGRTKKVSKVKEQGALCEVLLKNSKVPVIGAGAVQLSLAEAQDAAGNIARVKGGAKHRDPGAFGGHVAAAHQNVALFFVN